MKSPTGRCALLLAVVMTLAASCRDDSAASEPAAAPKAVAEPKATPKEPAKPAEATEAEATEAEAKAAEPTKPPPEPEPEPEPETPEDFMAVRNGVGLPHGATPEQVQTLWLGTKAGPDEDSDFILVKDAKGTPLLRYIQDEVCVLGPGLSAAGFGIGEPLSKVEHPEKLSCSIAAGEDLLPLTDPCPGESEGAMLICETDEHGFVRLFFPLPPALAERSGDRISASDLAEFHEATLLATLEAEGMAVAEEPGVTPSVDPSDRTLMIQSKDGAHAIYNDTPLNKAALEAAMPGFTARLRRGGNFNLYKGNKRVAHLIENDWMILLAPGLTDPNGIEVGAKFSALDAIPDLTCESSGGEEGAWFGCDHKKDMGTHQYFFMHGDYDHPFGELTREQARKKVGRRKLGRIEIWARER